MTRAELLYAIAMNDDVDDALQALFHRLEVDGIVGEESRLPIWSAVLDAISEAGAVVFFPKKASRVHNGERYLVNDMRTVTGYCALEDQDVSPGHKVTGNPMLGPDRDVLVPLNTEDKEQG